MQSWLNIVHNVAFLLQKLWSYFDYVMITWERIPGSPRLYIRVPGKPGNEARQYYMGVVKTEKA